MTGAMNAAIAGLKAHMNKLNVIGNNIANVNTNGFKPGRTLFKDSLYTTMTSGSDGSNTQGGINPSQIGYGVQIGSIDLDMTTGDYSASGNPLDCMINGDGFFLVGGKDVMNAIDPNDPESLKSLTLTRVGDFGFDADGYLTDGAGNVVYGFRCIGYTQGTDGLEPVYSDQLVPLRIPGYGQVENNNAQPGDPVEYEVKWPSDGHTVDPTTGALTGDTTQRLQEATDQTTGEEYERAKLDSIQIDMGTGAVMGTVKDSNETITIGYIGLGVVDNSSGVTHTQGPYYQAGPGAGSLSVALFGNMAEELGIDHVNGSLANAGGTGGQTQNLPDGMRIGGAGNTTLLTGGLEMSKTDLATEIAEMITTQRGYQANTRIITVTDSMLEELVNIKR